MGDRGAGGGRKGERERDKREGGNMRAELGSKSTWMEEKAQALWAVLSVNATCTLNSCHFLNLQKTGSIRPPLGLVWRVNKLKCQVLCLAVS